MGQREHVSLSRPSSTIVSHATHPDARARQDAQRSARDTGPSRTRALQPQLIVSAADDPFEREAERTSLSVTSAAGAASTAFARAGTGASLMSVAQRAIGKSETPTVKVEDEQRGKRAQRAATSGAGAQVMPGGIESTVSGLSGKGAPLPESVRSTLEPRFGHDFGSVRTHTGPEAAAAADAIGARAFTVGDDIFFAGGQFRPSSAQGQRLLAHELTHTVQQRPVAARAVRVQRSWWGDIKGSALARLKKWADELPAYELITIVIGRDPLTEKVVEPSLRNILHATLKLVGPDGLAMFEELENSKTIDKITAWFDAEVTRLDLTWDGIKALLKQAWDALGWTDAFDPAGAWAKIKAVFSPTFKRIGVFAIAVGSKIFEFVKKIVLDKISAWAKQQKGYTLLTFILGKNPLTGDVVPRTARTFVFAVLDLVPGGDKLKENLEKSKAIEKTVAWLESEIAKLDLSWDKIKELFRSAWDAFKVRDLLDPIGLFAKMADIFGAPLRRLLRFLGAVGMKVLQLIFEGAMLMAGPIGEQIVRIFHKIGDTFTKIIDDPIGFLSNLIAAVKLGFQQFGKNIWEHLKTGIIQWLVGALEGAGLVLPKVWDLKGIVDLVLQILGITYAKMRAKLVKVIGEERVALLERAFEFIKLLITEGPKAAWDKLVEAIGNLWDMVIGGIRDWAVTKIVAAAITKLVTMFNPVGALVQAIIGIYNTVAFFVERIKQILSLVEAIVDSIANIAAGKLSQAANYVEQAMARTIPVILGFLARLIGLGDVSESIKKVIVLIQEKVDKAIDKVIAWIVEKAKALFGAKAEPDGDAKWQAGAVGVSAEVDKLQATGIDAESMEKKIPEWKTKYGFKSLELVMGAEGVDVIGEMSPAKRVKTVIAAVEFTYTEQDSKASKVRAVPITQSDYSEPKGDLAGWSRLNHDYWVRGHLLHGRSSGPGVRWNMTPIPKTTNSAMYSGHERDLHDSLPRKGSKPTKHFTWFEAEVEYHKPDTTGTIKKRGDFPQLIYVRYGPSEKKGDKFTKPSSWTVDTKYPVDPPTTAKRDLEFPDA